MAKSSTLTNVVRCRISPEESNDIVNISKKCGISKSDILRMAIRSLKDSIKKSSSDIKKKAKIIKSEGRVPTIKELWGIDSDLVEKELNNDLYAEIIKNKEKKNEN